MPSWWRPRWGSARSSLRERLELLAVRLDQQVHQGFIPPTQADLPAQCNSPPFINLAIYICCDATRRRVDADRNARSRFTRERTDPRPAPTSFVERSAATQEPSNSSSPLY